MNLSITFSFAILLVGSVAAESKQCPPTSTGQYPKCICPQKDYPYDEINNICSIKLNFEKIPCPNGMPHLKCYIFCDLKSVKLFK